ncbi:MAG TPA: type II toxin-antitoxin system antitoxin SocA domain-containing protein [Longimicrobium sp.]|nr:type II toxin-antitoxin system antitoxin SocA domain-containing protein [Longimicrobium sp.]
MTTAQEVADYFTNLAQERGDELSNLKLQKLLYYAQGWHLGLHGTPLFPEKFQAWPSGPVIPDVFWRYYDFGIDSIPRPEVAPSLPSATAEFLDEVAAAYMPFDVWQLHWKTRAEVPWQNARGGRDDPDGSDEELSETDMMAFFRGLAVAA